MEKYFITCPRGAARYFTDSGSEWVELRELWRLKREELRDAIPREAWLDLGEYGTTFRIGPKARDQYSRILAPAGNWRGDWLDTESSQPCVGLWVRQREISRYGFPDLYEAKVSVFNKDVQAWRDISECVPVESKEEAFTRFRRALDSAAAAKFASEFGNDSRARLFGVAASPECLGGSLADIAPTLNELTQATVEIRNAASVLQDVLDKWEGTDALSYLERRRSIGIDRRFRWRNAIGEPRRLVEDLAALEAFLGSPEKRSGRRIQGGKQNLVAAAIASLWQSCGLGEPKLSPQSRFIRACKLVLPWHGVHKADVSQFMRGELGKKKHNGVLIG